MYLIAYPILSAIPTPPLSEPPNWGSCIYFDPSVMWCIALFFFYLKLILLLIVKVNCECIA